MRAEDEHRLSWRGTRRVKIWRAPDLYDAELLRGDYVDHAYPWHAHEEVAIGVVLRGGVELSTRRSSGAARRGSIVLVNSDEIHRGYPSGDLGWLCRTIHLHPRVVSDVAAQLAGPAQRAATALRGPSAHDPALARELLAFHEDTEGPGLALDLQSRIVSLIAHILRRHGTFEPAALSRQAREPQAVRIARSCLDADMVGRLGLTELAERCGLPPIRLLRAFRRAVGLTPHAYRVQARVRVAHALLRRQTPIADVAAQTGFADQAHMTRVFKSIMGGTPGQFRAAAR